MCLTNLRRTCSIHTTATRASALAIELLSTAEELFYITEVWPSDSSYCEVSWSAGDDHRPRSHESASDPKAGGIKVIRSCTTGRLCICALWDERSMDERRVTRHVFLIRILFIRRVTLFSPPTRLAPRPALAPTPEPTSTTRLQCDKQILWRGATA